MAQYPRIREQHIAVFGESGSGKTVLVSSFFGPTQEGAYSDDLWDLVADDTGQGNRLYQNYLGMRDHATTPSQTRFASTTYYFTVKLRGGDSASAKKRPFDALRLAWHDYPGEWFEESPSSEEEANRRRARADSCDWRRLLTELRASGGGQRPLLLPNPARFAHTVDSREVDGDCGYLPVNRWERRMVTSLEEVAHPSAVVELASTGSFVSGTSYLHGGRVEVTGQQLGAVAAIVRGTLPYDVRLWLDGEQLRWSCSCPAAEDGSFCKHCVAVALHLQPEGTDPFAAAIGRDGGDDDPADAVLAEYVDSLDHDHLAALVMEAADNDWRLRERLLLDARSDAGEEPAAQVWLDRLEIAFAPDGDWVTWHETGEWAADIELVLDGIDDLLHDGHPAMVIELAEHAYRLAVASREYVHHDSPAPADLAMRSRDLHLQACEVARPDPVDLARRLVALELDSEFDDFTRAAANYADVLGADGLAEYGRQVDARAASGASGDDRWMLQHRLEQARIGLALASGDPDAVIAAHGEQPSARAEVEIVRLLIRSDRIDDAEQRARDALDRLANLSWQLDGLRDLLADLLRRRGAQEEALELYVEGFLAGPSVSSYRKLLEEAGTAAEATADRAVAALEDLVRSGTDSRVAPRVQPAEALVRVLAHRGEVDRAWEIADEHGCSRDMWLTLAHARQDTHPLDAIEVYRREALAQIEAPKNHRYQRAVELLGRVRRLAEGAGEPELFERLLRQVRDEHGRKRNLTKLLDGKGW